MKQFAAEDVWADVSMREYDVLYTLSKCPGPVRISELNRHVLLSQPPCPAWWTGWPTAASSNGKPIPADGRGVRLSLTDAGRAMQRQVGRQHARSVARALTAALDPGELSQLETICQKLAGQPVTASMATANQSEDTRP